MEGQLARVGQSLPDLWTRPTPVKVPSEQSGLRMSLPQVLRVQVCVCGPSKVSIPIRNLSLYPHVDTTIISGRLSLCEISIPLANQPYFSII